MRAPLLCVIGVSLWSAATAAGQLTLPAGLPRELRAHVENARFDIVSSLNGLPGGVRAELQTLFGGLRLDIVDPGATFQGTARTVDSRLALRRLVAAGCSYEDCLVYYERAGGTRTWRVVLFHWTAKGTTLEWGGTAPGGLTAIDDVRQAVLSGAIKSSAGPW